MLLSLAASHERNPLNETFHRYCKWYCLNVDEEGFLSEKEKEIHQDLAQHNCSFESSSFLSLSILELYKRFDAKCILLVRRPEQVVSSLWVKGWYRNSYVQADLEKALGYQPQPRFHHFFSRIGAKGKEFETWNQMSRIGKIAWFWNMINLSVVEQFSALPQTNWQIVKLEDLSYPTYVELTKFINFPSNVTEEGYQQIVNQRPNALPKKHRIKEWSEREMSDFEVQVKPAAEHFGYEYRVDKLISELPPEPINPPLNLSNFVQKGWRKISRESKRILNISKK